MTSRWSWLATCAVTLVVLSAQPVSAQSSWLSGYLQTVPLFSGPTPLSEGDISNFSRFRVMTEPSAGAISAELAYEQTVNVWRQSGTSSFGLASVPSGGEWFDLDGTITRADQPHVRWRHRFDRMNVGWAPTDTVEVRVGRQVVSWGTTLFLTPADPFLPFSPSDPFRQYRGGVDAGRIRLYPGPLSQVDVVVRTTRTIAGEEVTALSRGMATWKGWELYAWGGTLYGDGAGAVGVSGSLGAWALRMESVIREIDGRVVGRGALGLDRIFQVDGRDLYVVFEYQRDGLGAASADDYLDIFRSREFQRGEFQVLGRDEVVSQASYQLHPLLNVAGLALWNVNDGSVLISPSVVYSAGDETSISGGLYLGIGDDTVTGTRPVPSEYGLSGVTGFAAISWFF